MMTGREHTLEKRNVHHKWDKRNPPAIEIEQRDTVHCETAEVTNNQVAPGCPASALGQIDCSQLYLLAGPIYIRSAEPGDILEVEILRREAAFAGIRAGCALCSLAVDLKISQIVDAPNWGVSAYLALSVFTAP